MSGEAVNFGDDPSATPAGFDPRYADIQRPQDARAAVLLRRLAEEAATLRAATRVVGDRIDDLARNLGNRRAF